MADLAYASGGVWQQGYFHGRPDLVRTGTSCASPRALFHDY